VWTPTLIGQFAQAIRSPCRRFLMDRLTDDRFAAANTL
jgi:hypothetical protein